MIYFLIICITYLLNFQTSLISTSRIDNVQHIFKRALTTKLIQLDSLNLTEEQDYSNITFKLDVHKSSQRVEILDNLNNLFSLANNSLRINGKLDRERLINERKCDNIGECQIKIKLAAYDSNNNLVFIYMLPIFVSDINDWQPTFKSETYRVNISENLISQTVVPLEAPFDYDSAFFSTKNCSIKSMHLIDLQIFQVKFNKNTQRLYLVINSALDREIKAQYDLILICTDGYSTGKTNLIVQVEDANDNVPYFLHDSRKPLNISVYENELIENLIKIEAVDNDDPQSSNGQLVFSLPFELNDEDINEIFKIDTDTGVIGLKQVLDYEKNKKFLLKIRVQDKGANSVPIYTDLIVNVLDQNDNTPLAEFSFNDKYVVNQTNNSIWIYEELEKDITIAYLTIQDVDMAASNGFNLNAQIDSIMYTDNQEERHKESESSFSFKLVPVIQEYNNLYYSLILADRVDREQKSSFEIKFKLSDNSNAAESNQQQIAHVHLSVHLIDINDNKPAFRNTIKLGENFEYYKFDVSENQLSLNFAFVDAYDADLNSNMEFKILDESSTKLAQEYLKLNEKNNEKLQNVLKSNLNPNYLFYINMENGSLSLRGELDREQCDIYLLTIRVSDRIKPDMYNEILVEINVLDENDNQPIYETNKIEFDLKENTPADSFVGDVSAQDADLKPKVEYFIQPIDFNRYFYVKEGHLYTKTQFDADKNNLTLEFKVIAQDSEIANEDQQQAELVVKINLLDLNDNAPELIYPSSEMDKLILFNFNDYLHLNQTNCMNNLNKTQKMLKKIKTIDMDKGFSMHVFKLSFIRRMSWQFVYEIVKNQMSNASNTMLTDDHFRLFEFIEEVIQTQTQKNIKQIEKVNLRDVFKLHNENASTTESKLLLSKVCHLNWGIYNFSVQIIDESSNQTQRTDLTLKLFAFDSNRTLTNEQTMLLNQMVDAWWTQNNNLIAMYRRRTQSNSKLNEDNGDDIDSITQEYYKFTLNRNSSINFLDLKWLLSHSSNSIVSLIAVFMLISAVLIVVIAFKHCKQKKLKENKKFKKQLSSDSTDSYSQSIKKSSQFVLNLNDSNNSQSIENSQCSSNNNLSSVKTSSKHLENELYSVITSAPDFPLVNKYNGSKTITTATKTTLTPESNQIYVSNNEIVTSAGQSLKSANLSTFIASNFSKTKSIDHESSTTGTGSVVNTAVIMNDLGYYGSSDYSDNNNSGISSANNKNCLNVKESNVATNSSTSFTSSSLLSSPSSSSSSDSFNIKNNITVKAIKQNAPIVTTLYPMVNRVENEKLTSKGPSDVKTYFERFEKIYNSEVNMNDAPDNNNKVCFKPRNSLTAYSYV